VAAVKKGRRPRLPRTPIAIEATGTRGGLAYPLGRLGSEPIPSHPMATRVITAARPRDERQGHPRRVDRDDQTRVPGRVPGPGGGGG
jgi:hypothetical protein